MGRRRTPHRLPRGGVRLAAPRVEDRRLGRAAHGSAEGHPPGRAPPHTSGGRLKAGGALPRPRGADHPRPASRSRRGADLRRRHDPGDAVEGAERAPFDRLRPRDRPRAPCLPHPGDDLHDRALADRPPRRGELASRWSAVRDREPQLRPRRLGAAVLRVAPGALGDR